ncbi:hypothetical protein WDU94_003533, partial [Cyamophila willieti]
QKDFDDIKNIVSNPPVLKKCDPNQKVNSDIENFVKGCQEPKGSEPKEQLLLFENPNRPFQRIHLKIMYFEGKDFLVIVDSYSKWIEMYKLSTKNSSEIISKLKILFVTYGIPETIVSDNSSFGSREIKLFAEQSNILWGTSIPNYPVSNGQSEKTVEICKNIMKKSRSVKVDHLETKMVINPNYLKPIKNLGKVHKEVKTKFKVNQKKYKFYYYRTRYK